MQSHLCFCLRSDVAAGMPHNTCASVSAPVVLVSPGKSSQESRLTGSVWKQQGSQTPTATVPKSGAHHMVCGMVGRKRRKIIHSPWTNAKAFKTTQHPHTSSPALTGHTFKAGFWQPMKMGQMRMYLNDTALVASCPEIGQPGLASC